MRRSRIVRRKSNGLADFNTTGPEGRNVRRLLIILLFLMALLGPPYVVATRAAATGPQSPPAAATTGAKAVSSQSIAESLLPADRNASANWRMAGLLSVGGIPHRTTVCATINPRGNDQDDTVDIQNAINKCAVGQVVSLAAGIFTISEGHYVALNKGITLRGAGPGVTTLQRKDGATLGKYQPGSTPSPMIIVGPLRWNNNSTSARR